MTAPQSRAWRVGRAVALTLFAAVFVVPLGAGLVLALREGSSVSAWIAMVADPQLVLSWWASVRIAITSTLLLAAARDAADRASARQPRMGMARCGAGPPTSSWLPPRPTSTP